jgi:hypothetical protein
MTGRPIAVAPNSARSDTTGFDSHPSERRGRTGALRRGLCALVCVAGILAAAPSASFADGLVKEASIGMGTFLATAVYSPVKLTYAFGGMVVGGLAWVFSGGDSEVAGVILTPSLRGSYVLTPGMLQGKDEIEFFGRSPEYRESYAGGSQDSEDSEEGGGYAAADSRW